MTNPLDLLIAIPIALAFALAAWAIWYALVRPVPERRTRGVIVAREFWPAEVRERVVARVHRGIEYLNRTQRFQEPDRHVYRIRLEGPAAEVPFSVASGEKEVFDPGQEVEVTYQVRGLPGVWSRVFVCDIAPVETVDG